MSNIIIPNFPANPSEEALDQLYKWSQDAQEADRMRHEVMLEKVKKFEEGIGAKKVDGLGECYAQMDSRMYQRWVATDQNFFDDHGNVQKFFKDNPEYLNEGYSV